MRLAWAFVAVMALAVGCSSGASNKARETRAVSRCAAIRRARYPHGEVLGVVSHADGSAECMIALTTHPAHLCANPVEVDTDTIAVAVSGKYRVTDTKRVSCVALGGSSTSAP